MPDGAYFDREYFRLHDGKLRYLEYLVDLLRRHGVRTGPVLDVGSGFGFFLGALGRHGSTGLGLERSIHACRHAARFADPRVAAGDAEAPFPFRSGSFNAVTQLDVIEHLEAYGTTLAECRRVLRPGGKLFVITLNRFSIARPFLGKCWSWYQDPTHVHVFSARRLRRDLSEAGFVDVGSTTLLNFCSVGESTPLLAPLRRIGRVVHAPAFGDAVLVVGTAPGETDAAQRRPPDRATASEQSASTRAAIASQE